MIGKIQSLCSQPNGHGQQASSASLDPLVPPLLGQDWPARPGGIPDPEGWGQAPGQVGFYRTNSLKLSVVTSFIVSQFHLCVRPFTLHSLLPQGPVKRHPFKKDVQIRPLDGKDEQRSTVVIGNSNMWILCPMVPTISKNNLVVFLHRPVVLMNMAVDATSR